MMIDLRRGAASGEVALDGSEGAVDSCDRHSFISFISLDNTFITSLTF